MRQREIIAKFCKVHPNLHLNMKIPVFYRMQFDIQQRAAKFAE
jgi:hypothetical protein